ncbi:hypothetical protein [Nitrosopumilus sp.]|uniref:hypothetical protein n=1 Tax=Nitrosopumilus sp. TaxID=2024843 RepID=UPI0034A00ACA
MNILIGLVIAMFIITGAYVGHHASQQSIEVAEGHDVKTELDVFNHDSVVQILQISKLDKSII